MTALTLGPKFLDATDLMTLRLETCSCVVSDPLAKPHSRYISPSSKDLVNYRDSVGLFGRTVNVIEKLVQNSFRSADDGSNEVYHHHLQFALHWNHPANASGSFPK